MDLKCKKKNTELLLGYKYFQFSQIQKFYIKQIEKNRFNSIWFAARCVYFFQFVSLARFSTELKVFCSVQL